MLAISLVCGKILTNRLSGGLKMTILTTAEETTIEKIINHLVKVCPEQLVSLKSAKERLQVAEELLERQYYLDAASKNDE